MKCKKNVESVFKKTSAKNALTSKVEIGSFFRSPKEVIAPHQAPR